MQIPKKLCLNLTNLLNWEYVCWELTLKHTFSTQSREFYHMVKYINRILSHGEIKSLTQVNDSGIVEPYQQRRKYGN
jgi:hypothetical protein